MTSENPLASVPLFAGLEPAALESLAGFMFRRSFAPGEPIVEEGRTGNGLFIVLTGRVEVLRGLGGPREQKLTELGPGEPFGEMALLGEWPRTATVRALEPTECLGLDRWIFLEHLSREPALAIRLLQIMAQRLAETTDRFSE